MTRQFPTPTKADLIRFDRKRKGKTLSNKDWESPSDPSARIAKLKDGRTHLAHKPEHIVDLDSSAIVAVKIHHADKGDTETAACDERIFAESRTSKNGI